MSDDGGALDAPAGDDVCSDQEPDGDVPEAATGWSDALSAELHKRALAPMSLTAVRRDLGFR